MSFAYRYSCYHDQSQETRQRHHQEISQILSLRHFRNLTTEQSTDVQLRSLARASSRTGPA